ncbi:MAG: hypothetical protein ACK47B_23540 [Armatimonadota bacterium]
MPAKKTPSPTEQALNGLILKKLEGHPNGLTQTQLISKFRSPDVYGPRYTFHPNAIKKAVARLAEDGRVELNPDRTFTDLRVRLLPAVKNEEAADV